MAYTKISNKTQDKDIKYLNKDFNSFYSFNYRHLL